MPAKRARSGCSRDRDGSIDCDADGEWGKGWTDRRCWRLPTCSLTTASHVQDFIISIPINVYTFEFGSMSKKNPFKWVLPGSIYHSRGVDSQARKSRSCPQKTTACWVMRNGRTHGRRSSWTSAPSTVYDTEFPVCPNFEHICGERWNSSESSEIVGHEQVMRQCI